MKTAITLFSRSVIHHLLRYLILYLSVIRDLYDLSIVAYKTAKRLIDEYIYFYNHERIQLKTKQTPLEKRRLLV